MVVVVVEVVEVVVEVEKDGRGPTGNGWCRPAGPVWSVVRSGRDLVGPARCVEWRTSNR